MAGVPFALQLYTVRDHMAKDPEATLKRVKEMGYDYVELAGTANLSPSDFTKLLSATGLTATSAHVGVEVVTTDTAKAASEMKALGIKYAVVPWAKGEGKDGWANMGKTLSEAGAKMRQAGLQLCYHNHAHEFEKFDGAFAFDIMMNAAQPEYLAAEIDTYWVKFGKADPVAMIKKYKGRCPLLHIKDMTPGDAPTFTEVGRGILDWKAVFAAGRDAGTVWYIVEQDTCAGDSLESAAVSAQFMARQQFP